MDTLYPRRCPICECILLEKQALICSSCRSKLPFVREPYCRRCGRPVHDERNEYCIDCQETTHYFHEGRAVFRYEGRLRDSLLRMKFQNRREYIPFFAASMAAASRPFLERIRPDVVIPVPMNERKRRERGFDQCSLLAGRLSGLTGIPTAGDILVRTRYTRPQKGLGLEARRDNLRSAFAINSSSYVPDRILLLDDIYTTGSTMDEAAKTLLERNAQCRIYYLTLCIGMGREEM